MDANQMREQLKTLYGGSRTWADKVRGMSDAQVLAIFKRMKTDGMLK